VSRAYAAGEWIDAPDGRTIPVTDPFDGALIAEVPDLGPDVVRRAIDKAHEVQKEWAARTAKERSQILKRWYDVVLANADDLALILTTEQGKPLSEAKGEVVSNAAYIEWFAEEAKRINGDIIPPARGDQRIVVLKQPVGVCAAITPWNFPNGMITRKAGPALAAGCTMVLKPAAQTPLSAFALAVLAERAGLGSTFFEPTVMTGITQAMKVAKEETFAPLAPVIRFKDEADVIAMANDTEFGLASYFYAKDMARVWRVAEALESGMVGVNTGLIANEMAPFGGVKQSGLGREGSKYGIEGFLEIKYVCLSGI